MSSNYRINEQDQLESGGAKTRAKQNIAAIRLLQELDSSKREASPQEQGILVQYSGWGAAPDIFTAKPDWADLQNQLREILTESEYAAARASTLNAHYTAPAVVSEVYRGLEQLGFTGGQILDPSMGATGMFEGLMPDEIAQRSDIMGVELDQISGRIARHLYPESTIHISGFQDVILPDDYFDLTISNVPFGQNRVSDPEYKGLPVDTLHDYFFAKGIDKVRPGGLVAYITSTGTMQSARGTAFREHMAERVNLIGAMRLPGDAFKAIAKTDVTTDLIILQKLGDGVEPNGVSWSHLEPTSVLDAEGRSLRTNEYYAQRPEMMLGTLADDKLYPGRLALKGDGRDLAGAMREAFSQMPTGIYRPRTELEVAEIEDDRFLVPPELQRVKQYGHTLYQDQVMVRVGGWLTPAGLTGKPLERVVGLISIREAVQDVFDVQLRQGSDLDLEEAQRKLSDVYDGFVKQHGYIHERGNKLAFGDDPDYPLLLALENYDRETKSAAKTDIFNKRTIQHYEEKTHADTPKEGLLYSLNEKGRVDVEYIAQLTGLTAVAAVAELQRDQLVFLNPDNDEYQTQDEYLSGNVRAKLAAAEAALVSGDPQFTVNVEALKAVQPEPLGPGDIDVRLGSTWVPASDIQDFTCELLGVPEGVSVRYSEETSSWYASASASVERLASNTNIHGTEDRSAIDLIENGLNLKTPSVYMADPHNDDRRIINPEATLNARLKQEEIKQKFKDWIWQAPDRAERLTDLYNERFNIYRDREFDGSHLELPGMNPNITLRPHQKNAVWRSLFGNTLDAHAVGGGKTFTMIASGMEQKRLGLINKAMYVVPNHLLEQIAGDFKRLYPTANVLAATKKDSQKSNRQELMSRIATGNWDAVIVTHSAFEKLKLSEQSQSAFINKEIAEVRTAIEKAEGSGGEESRRVMKDLERRRLSLEAKVEAIANSDTKDNTITFDQLGIDLLVVDEAHYFKNLGYTTKMRSIAGLPNTNSNKAFDMHMKVQYMAQVRGEGQGVIFATGTPITNSMAELFTMQRYLQPEVLAQAGLSSFDSWASTFGEAVTATELGPTGQFRVNTRFAKFSNVPDLMRMFRQSADIQTADMLNLPVPEIAGGKPIVIAVSATEDQLSYMDELVRRAEEIQKREVDPTEDNMLKLTGDGRKASADMRLVDPDHLDMPTSKTNRLVRDAIAFHEEHKSQKTHLIFCDLGTPKPKGEFSVYQDIKDKLVAGGIPPAEIAFAQNFKTDAQKLELQQKFNAGTISILISGAQLETGFNGQRKLGRISHLTVPWRPDQIEQRDGRGLRQGNENKSIEIFRYVTQGRNGQPGMEGYLWQTLQTKEQYISQAMRGSGQRQMEDISEAALSYSEIKAIATGDPRIMEKATVDNKITELSAQKRSYLNSQHRTQQKLKFLPGQIQAAEERIAKLTDDLVWAKEVAAEGKVILWNETLSLGADADEIGKRIRSYAVALNKTKAEEKIGSLGKFSISISTWGRDYESAHLIVQGENRYSQDKILQSKAGAYNALIKAASPKNLTQTILHNQRCIASYQKDLADLLKTGSEPFPKEAELRAALSRQAEINTELSIGREDEQVVTEPEGKRVASPTEQKEELGKKVANFIQKLRIQKDVVSPEGFHLTVEDRRNGRLSTLDAVPTDQDVRKLELHLSNVSLGTDPLSVTVEFSIDQGGILSLDSITASEASMPPGMIEVRLGAYLAANQFRLPTKPSELKEPETSSVEPENLVQQLPQPIPPSDPQEWNYSHATVSVEGDRIDVSFKEWPTPEFSEELKQNGFEAERATGPWSVSYSPERLEAATRVAKDYSTSISSPQAVAREKPTPKSQQKATVVQSAGQHLQRAERNVAKLLHEAGVAEAAMGEFHLKIENDPYLSLTIESHAVADDVTQLYLTHYRELNGDLVHDGEMVFDIRPDGALQLKETAVQNPFTGSESRIYGGGDRTFASAFARNLVSQGFAKAAKAQMAQDVQQPTTSQPILSPVDTEPESVTEPAEPTLGKTSPEMPIIEGPEQKTADAVRIQPLTPEDNQQAIDQPPVREPQNTVPASQLIQRTIEKHDPELHKALIGSDSAVKASVQSLRDWYVSVRTQIKAESQSPEQKRSLEERLKSITLQGQQAQVGSAQLTPAQAEQMSADLEWLKERYPPEPVTIGELRQWYRVNVAIDAGKHRHRIEELATNLRSSGKESIEIPSLDYKKMRTDLHDFQVKVGAEAAPNVQKIWNAAESQRRIQVDAAGQRSLPGENYKIVAEGDKLILTNQRTTAQITLENGQMVENTLTQADADQLQRFASQSVQLPRQATGVER